MCMAVSPKQSPVFLGVGVPREPSAALGVPEDQTGGDEEIINIYGESVF